MKIMGPGGEFEGWRGENPYFLVINAPDQHIVDLDEPGWMSEIPGLLRAEGEWVLVAKRDNVQHPRYGLPILALRVLPGEQPYYTKHTVGRLEVGEVHSFGIGKKRVDGHVDRLWILPNSIVCPGDDVDIISERILDGWEAEMRAERDRSAAAGVIEGPAAPEAPGGMGGS